MAAEALEQSMLESKDKDQLLAIAQALGISATARASKATLIGKILETTGVTQASGASADAPAAAATAAPAPGDGAEGAGAPEVVLGPDGEPLSDWELELWKKGQLEQVAPTPAGRAAHRGGGRGADPEGVDGDDHGDDDDGDGDDDGDEGGSGESRNARRRRRRRNKNRGEGDGGPVGPGSQAGQNGQGAQNGQHGQGSGRDRNDRNDRGDRSDRGDRGDRGEPQVDAWSAEPVPVEGHLDLRDEGYGFLRLQGFVTGRDDAYVPVRLVRQLGLRRGDFLVGMCRPAGRNEKNPALVEVSTVNGLDPEAAKERPRFDELTPVHPSVPLRLEGPAGGATADPTGRVIDLVAPIGKGQRGLVVAPPRAGKTTVLKALAASLQQQHPEVDLTVVLLDERPEEVTDVRRAVSADVVASTFDRPADEHVHLAELVLEKAKRLAETGRDVVLVVDGITRLTRAYNLVTPTSGRVVAGNLDAAALHPAKRFLGAARALEEGGSLTIIATASAGGNRVDEAILEEIEGTANMVLRLDRRLAERRVVPAIDVEASGTRHADALLGVEEADRVQGLRRRLLAAASTTGADGGSAVEALLTRIAATASNAALLTAAAKEKGA